MRVQGKARSLRRELSSIHEPAKNDGAGSLNVIIEEGIFVAESVEVEESTISREVLQGTGQLDWIRDTAVDNDTYLELNEQFWESARHLVHELVHELGHFLFGDALLAKAQVEGVIEVLLRVGSKVQTYGDGRFGAYTMKEEWKTGKW